jgi:hypothetical protein
MVVSATKPAGRRQRSVKSFRPMTKAGNVFDSYLTAAEESSGAEKGAILDRAETVEWWGHRFKGNSPW